MKNIRINKETRIYSVIREVDSMRTAEVCFENFETRGWEFTECKFSGTSKIYSIDDWQFLSDLNDFINDKLEELNK